MKPNIQHSFLQRLETHISSERLLVYAAPLDGDRMNPKVTVARYMLNMALCESLYPSLQNCEIALRNAIHHHLTDLVGREDWYDAPHFQLTTWAQEEVRKAKVKIQKQRKPITAGRVVSELQFGFWTSLFEAHYEQNTSFLPSGIKAVFPYLPKSLHKRKDRKNDLEHIRSLRNRVFHHERIVHWKDLDAQHELILQVISWLSPELRQMTIAIERFQSIRNAGLTPFLTSTIWGLHQSLEAKV
jgi:Abi-like protein